MTTPTDGDDPEEVAAWLDTQRTSVAAYLAAQEIPAETNSLEAEWVVAPIVAIWKAPTTQENPRAVWVISGDVPTDYIPASWAPTRRDALRKIAQRWKRSAELMSQGVEELNTRIGRREDWPKLAPMLASRARTLLEWADDDDVWVD